MNTTLTRCAAENLDTLREISISTFYETFAHMNTAENINTYLRNSFCDDTLLNELDNADSEFYLLYCDQKAAGYIKLNEAPSQTDINDKSSLQIERIYLLSEFQGKGLGRYLLEQALIKAYDRNKKYVWLGVWEENDTAIKFYMRNGFYKIGSHSFYMGSDEQTDYIMRKDL